jgi:ABC-2 type transport system permease protein
MTRWEVLRLVAGREARERLRSKALMASTVGSLVVLVAVIVIAGLAAGEDDTPEFDVGVVGARGAAVASTAADLAEGHAELDVTEVPSEARARRLVDDDDLDAVVLDDRILVAEELDPQLAAILQAAHREVVLADVLTEAGATPEQQAAAAVDPLPTDAVEAGDTTDDRVGVATIGTLLLYGQLIGFGYWVAAGIVEEKSSRVVELLLAKARPRPLLAGKVLGIGVVGVGQLLLFLAVGVGTAALTDVAEVPPGTGGVAGALVGWFVAGYTLYACLFAMGGAIASRAEDLQGTTAPITVVVMVAFFGAVFTSGDPEGAVAVAASLFPLTAPLSMPIRMAAGAAGPAEVALAVALVLATIALVVQVAARAYAGGALATRGRLKLREALARADA